MTPARTLAAAFSGACALAAAAAGPAQALSCMAPDAVAFYGIARDAEQSYIVVAGRLTPEAAPPTRFDGQTVAARLTGRGLGAESFSDAWDGKITIRVDCLGDWGCGEIPAAGDWLVFLETTPEGPVLHTSPCGPFAVPAPSDADLDRLLTCHRGGACDARAP